jgi:hypothetical protein
MARSRSTTAGTSSRKRTPSRLHPRHAKEAAGFYLGFAAQRHNSVAKLAQSASVARYLWRDAILWLRLQAPARIWRPARPEKSAARYWPAAGGRGRFVNLLVPIEYERMAASPSVLALARGVGFSAFDAVHRQIEQFPCVWYHWMQPTKIAKEEFWRYRRMWQKAPTTSGLRYWNQYVK